MYADKEFALFVVIIPTAWLFAVENLPDYILKTCLSFWFMNLKNGRYEFLVFMTTSAIQRLLKGNDWTTGGVILSTLDYTTL